MALAGNYRRMKSLKALTVVRHEELGPVGEAAVWLQRVPTAGVFTGRLEVDHTFNTGPGCKHTTETHVTVAA